MSDELTTLSAQLAELESALDTIQRGGVASASISSGGGSKSYTYLRPSEIRAEIDALRRRIGAMKRGGAGATCYFPFGGG